MAAVVEHRRLSRDAPFTLEHAKRASASRPALLYADSCPKCRWMARTVLRASAGTIAGIPLDIPQWRHFYAEELPESRGWPVLILNGRPYWGAKLYPMTLYLAAAGFVRSLRRQR